MFFVFCSSGFTGKLFTITLAPYGKRVNNWNLWEARGELNFLLAPRWDHHKALVSTQHKHSCFGRALPAHSVTSTSLLHLQRVKDHVRSVFPLYHPCVYFKQTMLNLTFTCRYDNKRQWRGSGKKAWPRCFGKSTLRSCFEFLCSNCPNILGSWQLVLVSHVVGWKSTAVGRRKKWNFTFHKNLTKRLVTLCN